MAEPVTPAPALTSYIATGNEPVMVFAGGETGGFITNPASAEDQAILQGPEYLYVDCVGQCTDCTANGTTFAIAPGQTWNLIPGQTTPTYVNAPTSGHKFSAVGWK